MLLHIIQHPFAFNGIDATDVPEMLFKIMLRHISEAELLGQGGGVHIPGLLGHHQSLHQDAVCAQEANTESWRDHLREASGVDDSPVCIQCFDGGQEFALVPEFAVGIVL